MFEAKSRRMFAGVLGLVGIAALVVGALWVAALAQATAQDDAGSVTAAIPDGPTARSAEQDAAGAAALNNDFEVLAQSTPTAATQSLAPSIAAAERLAANLSEPIYFNDFAAATDIHRIDHFVDDNAFQVIDRLNRYTEARAADLRDQGERGWIAADLRRFFSRFFRCYVRRSGWREGGWGLLIALCAGLYPLLSTLKARLEPIEIDERPK